MQDYIAKTYRIKKSGTAYTVLAITWKYDPLLHKTGFHDGNTNTIFVVAWNGDLTAHYDQFKIVHDLPGGKRHNDWVIEDLQCIRESNVEAFEEM